MNSSHSPGQVWRLYRAFEAGAACAAVASNAMAGQSFIGNHSRFMQQQEKS